MPNIYDVAQQYRQELLAGDARVAADLVSAYAGSWDEIQGLLDELLQLIEADGAVGKGVAGLTKYATRLQELQQQVEGQLARFAGAAGPLISDRQRQLVELAQEHTRALAAAGLGEPPPGASIEAVWHSLPTATVEQLLGHLDVASPMTEVLKGLGAATAQAIKQELVTGVVLGRSSMEIGRRIQRASGVSLTRALTWSRTETLRAYREASRLSYLENKDVVSGWIWTCALSSRSCAACVAMHGTFHSLQERLDGHPNCFPAGTIVASSGVKASSTRWYEGEIVELETSGGHFLAVTPNHPILTFQGWLAAGELHEGSYIISSRDAERVVAVVDPDNYQVPARIEDVAVAVGSAVGVPAESVPLTPVDFHGDWGGSEVGIIRTNGLLENGLNASLDEPITQEDFVRGCMQSTLLSGLSASDLSLDGINLASPAGVGELGQVLPFLNSAPGGQQTICLTCGAPLNAQLLESSLNDIPRDAVAPSEGGFGLPSSIPISEVVNGNIAPTRVISTRRKQFAGHVYNLQTKTGWYIANGIITHNCRCVMVPKTKSWSEVLGSSGTGLKDETDLMESGEDWFALQPVSTKLAVLGPRAYKAYREQQVELGDFVGRRFSTRWGSMRYTLSLKDALAGAAGTASKTPLRAVAASTPSGGAGRAVTMRVRRNFVNPEWARMVDHDQAAHIKRLAVWHGMGVRAYKRAVTEHIKELVARSNLYKRIGYGKLLKVLKSGRFMSQFETGTSEGALMPSYREQVEYVLFNTAPYSDVKLRPQYGYMAEHDAHHTQGLEQYGWAAVRFKSSLRDRTTFMFGDSLDLHHASSGYGQALIGPAAVEKPHMRAGLYMIGPVGEPLRFSSMDEVPGYVEAQYHGGVIIDDIEEVIFLRNVPGQELQAALKKAGIPWRVEKPKRP